jgi:hypothetical protein
MFYALTLIYQKRYLTVEIEQINLTNTAICGHIILTISSFQIIYHNHITYHIISFIYHIIYNMKISYHTIIG